MNEFAPVPDPALLSLGIAVATARAERSMSIDALALAADIDRKTVMRLERGEHAVSISVLHAVAHVLDVPLGALAERACDIHSRPGGLGQRDPSEPWPPEVR
ncbi:MAG: helix-turn-helix transcriptional regulator [Brevibacterium aurantiacum]|uniref:Uncharacterized protein n=1 Tax=Brevibacterium aurantiacum TaxID=273384 RepID=A0A2A3ZQ11_BREAU|nr:hypothetical protein CIK59_10290 [Brevibacterium aurantiacum]RCS96326.1 XRE family transcriptional regulator [Brevibacterium aurantiacum]